ncbi:MAG: trigger factor [Desulfobulbaceae bacterium]|nr:MAG: trigger factor [Desulfobulbaceae bacterium]
MQVSVEESSALGRALTIVVPEKEVKKRLDKAFRKLAGEVEIRGFRKGKAPRKVLEQRYGESVYNEVAEKIVQDTYFDALEESKLEAVVHPDIRSHSFDDVGTFTYVAEIDIKPDFELGTYKGLEVELPALEVSEEDIAARLESMRREMAPLRSVEDRGAEQDDIITIDFTAFEDGEEMQHVKGSDYPIDIGSGKNGKVFEDAMLGLKVGDEVTKEIEFPVDFANQILAGKTIEFHITVKDLKERVLTEINDEFAQEVSADFKSLDDLKADIKEKIAAEREKSRSGDLTDVVMLKLLENHDFEVPQRLVAHEISHHIKQLEETLERQNMTLEAAGLSREKLIEDYKEDAEKRVKGDFILKKIAEVEDIKVEDEDLSKGFQRIAEQYAMSVDDVKKYFARREDLLPFMHEILNEKIVEFLRSESTINYVEAS